MLTEMLMSLAIVLGTVAYVVKKRLFEPSRLKAVPGPWGIPIFGNMLQFGENPGLTFLKWKNIYGPIFSIKFGSIPTVILNDAKHIKKAFGLQCFSGRPLLSNFEKASGFKGLILTDGERQVEQRKFSQKYLTQFCLTKSKLEFYVTQEMSTFIHILKNKLNSTQRVKTCKPASLKIKHFFLFPVVNSLWIAIMGQRFDEAHSTLSHLCKLVEGAAETGSILGQLSWFFQWVSHVLSFLGVNKTVQMSQAVYMYMEKEIEKCRKDFVPGHPTTFTHAYFDKVLKTSNPNSSFFESRQEQKITTGDIFIAAVDSTTTSLDWFLYYMAQNPKIQVRIHAEIDAILGKKSHDISRAPSLSDKEQMPYTEAAINELLRISSVTPLALMHRTLENVNFESYHIPKDTMVIANIYGVHHDPDVWLEPAQFSPDRFLTEQGQLNTSMGASILPFSSGKRNCIGEGFARDSLFLIITNFFQQFTVSYEENNIPSLKAKFGFITAPDIFNLSIEERK